MINIAVPFLLVSVVIAPPVRFLALSGVFDGFERSIILVGANELTLTGSSNVRKSRSLFRLRENLVSVGNTSSAYKPFSCTCRAIAGGIATTWLGSRSTASVMRSLVIEMYVLSSEVPNASVALILLVSSGERLTVMIKPSGLTVPPLDTLTAVAFSDGSLRNVIADASSEDTDTISLKVRVTVLLLRLSSKSTNSGGRSSSTKRTSGLASVGGTGMREFPDMSSTNSSVSDIQQLLISEQSPLCR